MAKKTKPAAGHSLVINAEPFVIDAVDVARNRVDYVGPSVKGRNPTKGVAALGDLVWSTDADAWALPGREHKKSDTGGVKRVTGPAPK
jgi:hypothetical protein